jgi:hypothetical protein
MDMHSRNQYLQTSIKYRGYFLKSKKEKSRLLYEYCSNIGLNIKYVIRKIRSRKYGESKSKKRRRKEYYYGYVKAALVRCLELFDFI